MYGDVKRRDNYNAPAVDVHVAGFPCQPFSIFGLQQGFADKKGRGDVVWSLIEYIELKLPKIFVLENVKGFVGLDSGKYYNAVMDKLKNFGRT